MCRDAQRLEAKLEILKRVAGTYSHKSEEHETVRWAAEALLFISEKGYFNEFEDYIKEMAEPLSDEQIARLKSLGCSP